MRVEFAEEAACSLEQIGDYMALDSPSRAQSLIREIREAALSLGDTPKAYPLVPRYEQLGVRRRVHGAYLIFYRIEPNRVVAVQIAHGARDYGRLLLPED